jgi:hypothetical protein
LCNSTHKRRLTRRFALPDRRTLPQEFAYRFGFADSCGIARAKSRCIKKWLTRRFALPEEFADAIVFADPNGFAKSKDFDLA